MYETMAGSNKMRNCQIHSDNGQHYITQTLTKQADKEEVKGFMSLNMTIIILI